MSVLVPGFGVFFWMTIIFILVVFILGKFAWPPILKGLKEREDSIKESLEAAKDARDQMKQMQAENEKLLQEAKEERDAILAEARKIKDKIIDEARMKALQEADSIVESAREQINNEKRAALIEMKNLVADYSIQIAEKVLKEELKEKQRQHDYVEKLIEETNLN
ncbi:MAG: F0F1 ATP synthase subunit B [Bacteroidales bacterium]|nr:F0F1 ATP synthase subunit B [Bacteroidales bacterium]